MRRAQLLLAGLLVFGATAPLLADDAALQVIGGALQPMVEHPTVVMASMDVNIVLTPEASEIDCEFLFRNTGPATTVVMGFPESGTRSVGSGEPTGLMHFTTSVDGRPAETRKEGFRLLDAERRGWERWRVKEVQFSPGQVRRVRVSYGAPTAASVVGERLFTYRFGTGGSWQGPIEHSRVRLAAHYDDFDWTFGCDERFTEVDECVFEWSTGALEPKSDEVLHAGFEPAGIAVKAGRLSPLWRPTLYRRDLKDGHFWVPIRWLNLLLGAEVDAPEGPKVRLTLGDRSVELHRGQPWMLVGERRVPLAGAPYVEDSRLIVPVADIARALGATVQYLRPERELQVTMPIHRSLSAALPPREAWEAFSVLVHSLPGYTAPDRAQYDPAVLLACGRDDPWIAAGDFNGDGRRDVAVHLVKEDTSQLVAVHKHESAPGFGVRGLDRWPRAALDDGRLYHVVRAHPPGQVTYCQDDEAAPEPGRLTLDHDAIEVIAWEKATTLYHWDTTAGTYRSVITAD